MNAIKAWLFILNQPQMLNEHNENFRYYINGFMIAIVNCYMAYLFHWERVTLSQFSQQELSSIRIDIAIEHTYIWPNCNINSKLHVLNNIFSILSTLWLCQPYDFVNSMTLSLTWLNSLYEFFCCIDDKIYGKSLNSLKSKLWTLKSKRLTFWAPKVMIELQ